MPSHRWFFYNILFDEHNKESLPALMNNFTVEEILDYRESLEAMSMLKEASHRDQALAQKHMEASGGKH